MNEEFEKLYYLSLKSPSAYRTEVYRNLSSLEEELKPMAEIERFTNRLREIAEEFPRRQIEIKTKRIRIIARNKNVSISIGDVSSVFHVASVCRLFGDGILRHLRDLARIDVVDEQIYLMTKKEKVYAVAGREILSGSIVRISLGRWILAFELRSKRPDRIQKVLDEDIIRLIKLALSYK